MNLAAELKMTISYQNTFGGFACGHGSKIVYSNFEGMFLFDFETKIKKKLKCNCNSIKHEMSATNRCRTKIVFLKSISTHVGANPENLNVKYKLVMMDTDGEMMVKFKFQNSRTHMKLLFRIQITNVITNFFFLNLLSEENLNYSNCFFR